MKKCLLISIFVVLSISCSPDIPEIAPEIEEKIDLAPSEFEISLLGLTDNKATISWEKSVDPEGQKVTYTVLLNNEIQKENTEEREFEFSNLSELTTYTCKVIAQDINGKETSKELIFTTKKFYLKYLKEFLFEDNEPRSYGSPSNMIKTSEGDYIITGGSSDPGGSLYQSFALKIDVNGNQIWKHYYGNQSSQITNITESQDGGFILVSSHLIFKINSNGHEVWSTENRGYINPEFIDFLAPLGAIHSVKEDSKGNIFAVGYRGGAVPDPEISHFGVLTKINNSGEIIWEKEFRDSYRSTFDDLIIDEQDNIIIFGTADSNPGEEEKNDFWILKTESSGNLLWKRFLPSPGGYAFATQIIKTRDNNYAVAGFSEFGSGSIFKITPDGNEIWNNRIALSKVLSIQETIDGGFIAIGHIDVTYFDILGISKLSQDGNEDWIKSYQQSATHLRGKKIFQTEDQGFLFTVSSSKNYYYDDDRAKILVFKTDPEGNYE